MHFNRDRQKKDDNLLLNAHPTIIFFTPITYFPVIEINLPLPLLVQNYC